MFISVEKLRRVMKLNHFDAKGLSAAAGLSLAAIQKILRGDVKTPRPMTLCKLVRALNCSRIDIVEV